MNDDTFLSLRFIAHAWRLSPCPCFQCGHCLDDMELLALVKRGVMPRFALGNSFSGSEQDMLYDM